MVASQNEADVFRGRPEVQPVTHGHIRSCAVCREIDLVFKQSDLPDLSRDRWGLNRARSTARAWWAMF